MQEDLELHLNVAGLSPEERTALRETLGGLKFQAPAKRLIEMHPYLHAPDKVPTAGYGSKREAKVADEEFDATLFAYGFGEMHYMHTLVAMREKAGGDAVMCMYDNEDFGAVRVQVKGIVDPNISKTTLNQELTKLGPKYPNSPNLLVVVAIHASLPYPLVDLDIPSLEVGGLYILVAADDRLERWQLAGDLLRPGSKVGFEEFEYPTAPEVAVPVGFPSPSDV